MPTIPTKLSTETINVWLTNHRVYIEDLALVVRARLSCSGMDEFLKHLKMDQREISKAEELRKARGE